MKQDSLNSSSLNDSPIFIVGVPRSGTTLVRSMLSAHPNIAIPPETHFLDRWLNKNMRTGNSARSFWDIYSNSDEFSCLGLQADQVYARFSEDAEATDYRTIFLSILQEYAHNLGKRRWGEKTPNHYLYLGQLLDWFPHGRVIWMIRDPRSVVSSLLKTEWSSPYTHTNACKWRDSVQLFEEKWAKDSRVKLVKYESIVTKTEAELKGICDFIHEDFCSLMIEKRSLRNDKTISRGGWGKAHYENTLRPIDQKSIDKWQSELFPSQIAVIENIARHEMFINKYASKTKKMSLLQFMALIFSIAARQITHKTRGIVNLKEFYF